MAGDPRSRHLPPIPGHWLVPLDAALLVGAAVLASLVSRLVSGGAPGIDALLPERRFGFWVAWTLAHAVLVPLGLLVLGQYRVTQDPRGGWSYSRVLFVLFASFLGLAMYMALLGQPVTDWLRVVLQFSLSLLGVAGWRAMMEARLRRDVLAGRRVRNVLFVGEGADLQALALDLVYEPLFGRRVVGFVRQAALERVPSAPSGLWLPDDQVTLEAAVVENSLRSPRHLWASYTVTTDEGRSQAIDGLGAEEIFLSNRLSDDEIAAWVRLAQVRGLDAHLVPQGHEGLGVRATPWMLGGRIVHDLHHKPINTVGWVAKRMLDVVGSIVGLVVGLPLMIVAAIAIKLEDRTLSVFYPGSRVGFKGRVFNMAKFTTMRADAQQLEANMELQSRNKREGPWFKLEAEDDPRLTRSGRWIRKLSINEIPQFWNVLKGEMSLVGPRPPTPAEVATYLQYDFRYFQVLDVKPGITGLWQVTARHDPSFDRRLQLDLQYMREWSIWLDLKILLKTVGTVLGDREG